MSTVEERVQNWQETWEQSHVQRWQEAWDAGLVRSQGLLHLTLKPYAVNNWIMIKQLVWNVVDYEMALEYATQSGVSEEPRDAIFLQSLEAAEDNFIDLHSPTFVFRLFC
ncbi:hypothetical protein C1H46_014521 [Malus baccata]|uniref:Uncharacterized protein n=1 Tax=Malus baccata TaxID=106549 RepID=A0A540MMA3_MALBA|nr:hypothetical protein C1H46_014521 [Malus baccata]